MQSDLGKLAIILSVLLLIAFPFTGLAPLSLLLFVAVLGWVVRLFNTVVSATEAPESE